MAEQLGGAHGDASLCIFPFATPTIFPDQDAHPSKEPPFLVVLTALHSPESPTVQQNSKPVVFAERGAKGLAGHGSGGSRQGFLSARASLECVWYSCHGFRVVAQLSRRSRRSARCGRRRGMPDEAQCLEREGASGRAIRSIYFAHMAIRSTSPIGWLLRISGSWWRDLGVWPDQPGDSSSSPMLLLQKAKGCAGRRTREWM